MVLEHDFGISGLWFDPGTGLEMVLEHDFGISGLWFDPGTGLEMVLRRILGSADSSSILGRDLRWY
jgi:hypothetical protein